MINNLKANSSDALVLISQRVEDKVNNFEVFFIERYADLVSVKLQNELIDTLSNNVLNI